MSADDWLLAAKALVAYLLGSLSGSLLLGRVRGVDIRTLGSGNAGGTNALRTQGWRFALAVVAIDTGKGAVAASLAWSPPAIASPGLLAQSLLFTFAAAVGHVWPVFHGFRGGKGAATLLGGVLVVLPATLMLPLLAWIVTLGLTGYVGLATVSAALALLPSVLLFSTPVTFGALWRFALAVALLLAFTHRANLARVHAGTELRFERARFLARWLGHDKH